MKYKFYGIKNTESAQIWGEFTEKLNTKCTEKLLEAASDPKCEVHEMFDWNNTTAGHKHRLSQVRFYMGQLYVVHEKSPPIKAFESIRIQGVKQYLSTSEIKNAPYLANIVIDGIFKELSRLKDKLQQYQIYFVNTVEGITEDEKKYRSTDEKTETRKENINQHSANKKASSKDNISRRLAIVSKQVLGKSEKRIR